MPSTRYLWLSILLSLALQAWLFSEAGLHGAKIVTYGGPVIALSAFMWVRSSHGRNWYRNRLHGWGMLSQTNETDIQVELKEPLISYDDIDDSTEIARAHDADIVDESIVSYQPPIHATRSEPDEPSSSPRCTDYFEPPGLDQPIIDNRDECF